MKLAENNIKLLYYNSASQESDMRPTGLKWRCLQGYVPFWSLRRKSISLCFSSFKWLPAFLCSWPLPLSAKPAIVDTVLLTSYHSDCLFCIPVPLVRITVITLDLPLKSQIIDPFQGQMIHYLNLICKFNFQFAM